MEITPSDRVVGYLKTVETLVSPARHLPADRPGVITGGYGETDPKLVKNGMAVSAHLAEAWLRNSLESLCKSLETVVTVELVRGQMDALISLTYNIGFAAFAKSTLLRLLNANQTKSAAKEFARWVRANGKTLPGLVTRRATEAEWFMEGIKDEVHS